MTNLDVALIVTSPLWTVCVALGYEDRIRAWARRYRRNRLLRVARRRDAGARRSHRAIRELGGSRQL